MKYTIHKIQIQIYKIYLVVSFRSNSRESTVIEDNNCHAAESSTESSDVTETQLKETKWQTSPTELSGLMEEILKELKSLRAYEEMRPKRQREKRETSRRSISPLNFSKRIHEKLRQAKTEQQEQKTEQETEQKAERPLSPYKSISF
jgi:hypothetical protein